MADGPAARCNPPEPRLAFPLGRRREWGAACRGWPRRLGRVRQRGRPPSRRRAATWRSSPVMRWPRAPTCASVAREPVAAAGLPPPSGPCLGGRPRLRFRPPAAGGGWPAAAAARRRSVDAAAAACLFGLARPPRPRRRWSASVAGAPDGSVRATGGVCGAALGELCADLFSLFFLLGGASWAPRAEGGRAAVGG